MSRTILNIQNKQDIKILLGDIKSVYREKGALHLIRKSLEYGHYTFSKLPIINFLCLRFSLKRLPDNSGSIEEIVESSFRYKGFGLYKHISPSQKKKEIVELCKRVDEINPKKIMEIGTSDGGTLFIWTQYFNDAELFISLDLPGGRFGGGYTDSEASFFKHFSDKQINTIRQNSHSENTLRKVENQLAGEKLDFLLIDGDHTYEGVKKDFEMYSDLVRDGGIIAFHDIVPHNDPQGTEVDKFWREIKDEYETEEIVDSENQNWAGIGIIRVDK